jgi:hypothetical protein
MHEVSECGGKKRKTCGVRCWSSQALTAKAVNSNKSRLLLLLVTVLLGHADNDITISQVDAAAGETATVTVSLSNATPLAGFTVVIDYDLNRVVPVAYRAAGRASTHPLPDGDDGQLLTLVIDSPIPAGSGPIIDIDFRVRDDELPGVIPIGNGHIRVPPTGPPSLTLSLSLTDALEADPPVIATVTLHNVASLSPTRVTLQTADSARAAPPAFIDIPSIANSAQFEIQLPNDLDFGPDTDVLITASAAGIGSDSVTLHVRDDDDPAIPNLVIGAASPGTPAGLFSNTVTISDVGVAESASVVFSVTAGLGAREELSYIWTLDGDVVANSASFTLAPDFDRVAHPAEFANHQLICSVANSASATWNLRVTDTDRLPPAPTLSVGLTITVDPLIGVVTAPLDPDGDAILGLDISWTSPNGAIIPGDTVSSDLTQAGETWRLRAHARTAPYGDEVAGPEATLDVTIGEVGFELLLEPGWNLISLPIQPNQFPGQLTGALRWQNGFHAGDQLEAGVGYFLHCQTASQVYLSGIVPLEGPALAPGWNLIGPIAPPPFTAQDITGAWGLIDGRYRQVQAMMPGRGYWIYRQGE